MTSFASITTNYPAEIKYLLDMDPTTFQFLSDVDRNYHTAIYDALGRTAKLFLNAHTIDLREIDSLKSRIRGYESDMDGMVNSQEEFTRINNERIELREQLKDERKRAREIVTDILQSMREIAPAAYDQTISTMLLR